MRPVRPKPDRSNTKSWRLVEAAIFRAFPLEPRPRPGRILRMRTPRRTREASC